MTKAPIGLHDLRRKLYVKAKAEPSWRCWGLYVHVCKRETLRAAYRLAKSNNGAPGIDGVTFETIGTAIEYCRFADDLVVLVRGDEREDWLRRAVEKRLREEFAKLHVAVNEEKSRRVDLVGGECFGFLGFEFRRIRSRAGRWMPLPLPQGKKRTALLRKLKGIFQSFRSQPLGLLIQTINPILRGWVNYFAFGHSSRCFAFVRDWVAQKIRRHLGRARQRRGFGWKRWRRQWLYDEHGLFHGYRVRRTPLPIAVPVG